MSTTSLATVASAVSGIVLLKTEAGAAAVDVGAGDTVCAITAGEGDASSEVETTVGASGTASASATLDGDEAVVVVVDVEVLLLVDEGGGGVVVVVVVVGTGVVVVVVEVVVVVVVVVDVFPARNAEPEGRVGRPPPRRLVVRVVTEVVSGSAVVVVVRLVEVRGTRGVRIALVPGDRATGGGRVGRLRLVAAEETEELSRDSVVVVVFNVVLGEVAESSVALALASFGE